MPMFSASRKHRALARVSAIRAKWGRTFLLTLSGVASVGRVEAQFLMVCFLNPPV